jgi:uncharacterized protein (TIGR03437 family)
MHSSRYGPKHEFDHGEVPMRRTYHTLLALTLLAPAFSQNIAQPVVYGISGASAFGAFASVAAPGSWVEIYASNLAGKTRGWTGSDFTAAGAPTMLHGVSVNGTAAYMSYVSPTQVNATIPDNIATGVASVVSYQSQTATAAPLAINALEPDLFAPAAFKVGAIQYVAAVHNATGGYVSNGNISDVPAAPAVPGETLIFYGIGSGPVTQGKVAGQIASGQTSLANSFTMTIGGSPATIQYAGLAPGLVGLYQFNVVVPANLPTGDQPVEFSLNGMAVDLQTLFLPVSGASSSSTFTLTSPAAVDGGTLPAASSCSPNAVLRILGANKSKQLQFS